MSTRIEQSVGYDATLYNQLIQEAQRQNVNSATVDGNLLQAIAAGKSFTEAITQVQNDLPTLPPANTSSTSASGLEDWCGLASASPGALMASILIKDSAEAHRQNRDRILAEGKEIAQRMEDEAAKLEKGAMQKFACAVTASVVSIAVSIGSIAIATGAGKLGAKVQPEGQPGGAGSAEPTATTELTNSGKVPVGEPAQPKPASGSPASQAAKEPAPKDTSTLVQKGQQPAAGEPVEQPKVKAKTVEEPGIELEDPSKPKSKQVLAESTKETEIQLKDPGKPKSQQPKEAVVDSGTEEETLVRQESARKPELKPKYSANDLASLAQANSQIGSGIAGIINAGGEYAQSLRQAEAKEIEAEQENLRTAQELLKQHNEALRDVIARALDFMNSMQANMNQTRAKILG